MTNLDALYRALLEYKKEIENNREISNEQKAIVSAASEQDKLSVVKTECTVEEDWIEAIEKGLEAVEKAINEGRQFILSRGEVLPIEKVKRVSKDSVEHLAKHSDLLTREPPDKESDIIPDKLYVVERLSDFAVYENRFLYMLLKYLESFISFRYNKLVDLSGEYNGTVTIKRVVEMNKRKMHFALKLKEEKQNDAYLKENSSLKGILSRIDSLQKIVAHMLATPLMQEVSKAPMLKPPITKTNVLKMNQNFKGAVALYDFLTAYDKPGYIAERFEHKISPFPDEFSEILTLTSFLTYKDGLDLEKVLYKQYLAEEERRRQEEQLKQSERLEQLKKRIEEAGGDPIEYIKLLEKRNSELEEDSLNLVAVKKELESALVVIDELKNNIKNLNNTISDLDLELAETKEKHAAEIAELNKTHAEQILELNKAQEQELKERDEQVKQIKETQIKAEEKFKQDLKEAEKDYKDKENSIKAECENQVSEYKNKHSELTSEFETQAHQKRLAEAQLLALKREHNLIKDSDEFTSYASFTEIERQYKIFKSFFKDEWKKTKKRIKHEVYSGQSPGINETAERKNAEQSADDDNL